MALVAYDNSDSSDYENEDENAPVVEIIKKPEAPKPPVTEQIRDPHKSETPQSEPVGENSRSLFNLLPQPSTQKPTVIEEDDEFLYKKEKVTDIIKPKAKITVPSLNDFKDVDSTISATKSRTASEKKSGLLSILPQPKHAMSTVSKSFIPHILTKKPDNVKKKTPLPSPAKKHKEDKPLISTNSDESDEEDIQNDFFSFSNINKPLDIAPLDVPIEIAPVEIEPVQDTSMSKLESYFKKDTVSNLVELQPDEEIYEQIHGEGSSSYNGSEVSSSHNGSEVVESRSNDDLVLDEEAILKLCGARSKRKKEDIQIVDVNQEEVLGNAREWLLKSLMDDTSKRVSASKKRGTEPTSQQKRKHQITYLAHQAKANEADLQNQWANNRMSKRKTQSKYGF